MSRARRDREEEWEGSAITSSPEATAQSDGLPERASRETEEAFESRLQSHIQLTAPQIAAKVESLKYSILVSFIRHLNKGLPPSAFCFRDADGLALCDHDAIRRWELARDPAYLELEPMIRIASKQCEARWVEHLGAMASGKATGNIMAVELYTKRFFGWDVDDSGREEAAAIAEAFRGIASRFRDVPKQIDIP